MSLSVSIRGPIILFCLFLCIGNSQAQNTNSIYSAYGVGDINIRDWNAYTSMGGVGIALKSERTLNELNPASYSALTNHRYILELAAAGTSVNYISKDDNQQATDFNIKRAAFGMNLFKHVGTVFGIRKFSTVAYQTYASRYIEGSSSSVLEKIKGTGGINQLFISNSYAIGKHLSLGVSTGLLFGSVNKQELVYFNSGDGVNIETNNYYSGAFINTGVQYAFKTGKTIWTIGGTFQPSLKLNDEATSEIKDLSDNVLRESSTSSSKFQYPSQLAGGIAIKRGGSTIGVDYMHQDWASVNYKGASFTTTNLQNLAAGYSFTFYKNGVYGPVERASIMAGFQRELSYLVINNNQLNSWSGSLGVNFPSRNGMFNYTLGVRAGQRGEVAYPLVKEKFVDFTLNVSLGSLFYTGGRKYD
jgi:hypothetical protein